ncbi:RNA polymerase sigma factor cnrH [Bacteriophage sp.]|nr:RNA polymerase sigma factor cnrH [Bacteriophage sp.]
MTLKQIAAHEGVSHQMIEQILARAIRKFVAGLESRGIRLEDLI